MNNIFKFVFAIVFTFILFSCTKPTDSGKLFDNQLPETQLANIPPQDSVYQFGTAKVSLSWSGKDKDGFITAFSFRWNSILRDSVVIPETLTGSWNTILNISFGGDINSAFVVKVENANDDNAIPNIFKYLSTLTGNVSDSVERLLDSGKVLNIFGSEVSIYNPIEIKNPSRGTFIFTSSSQNNTHTFEVKSIDNKGTEDLTPATVSFGTPKIYPPDTRVNYEFTSTINGRKIDRNIRMMLPFATPTFSGVTYSFIGSDSLGSDLEYQYNIDDKGWSNFSSSDEVTFFGAQCDSTNGAWYDTSKIHNIIVRARNQYYLVDPTPDTLYFRIYVPEFTDVNRPKRYLYIDNTDSTGNQLVSSPESPSPQDRYNFYHSIFDSLNLFGDVDYYLVTPKKSFPNLFTLAKYSGIFFSSDKKVRGGGPYIARRLALKKEAVDGITSYLDLGGKMIISSWDLYNRIYEQESREKLFDNYLHLSSLYIPDMQLQTRECEGVNGSFGYPEIFLDTLNATKLHPSPNNLMDSILITYPIGFAQQIYSLKSSNSSYNQQPIGIRYLGPTYKIIYFGFPLYYTYKETAYLAIRQAFIDIGELNF